MRVALCLAALLISASARAEGTEVPPPLKPGLTEGVETRLVQFEVRVSRKRAPVSGLEASDFDIELGGKPLTKFTVDDMCAGAPAPLPGIPPTRPGSYVFYFDEAELSVDGRHRAIEVARLVAPALLAHGHDLMIVRNSDALRIATKWTHDPAVVSAVLDRIAADPGNGDILRAEAEQLRTENLLDRLALDVREVEFQNARALEQAQRSDQDSRRGGGSTGGGLLSVPRPAPPPDVSPGPAERAAESTGLAAANRVLTQLLHDIQPLIQDDLRRTQRDVARLRGVVRSLALRDSPKGIVYFADTLRRDPGSGVARTLDSAPYGVKLLNDQRWHAMVAPWNADFDFQALVRDSSTYGVRFYAVEGRGLGMPSNWVRTSQDTLASMALETGGLSFLNGLAPARIADQVAADQSCWYLVSFAPSGWATDRPLNLGVWPKTMGLRVQVRSALVIPSRATLTQTRLIAARFDDPALQTRPLSLSVYPVGGTLKGLQVLAQVRLPESDAPTARDALWDIGFDVVSEGEVVAHSSSGVTWRGNGQPPVYQATLSLPAGPYEIVAVAHEAATDSIRAGRINGTWPPLPPNLVTLSLPALAQPQRGGIVLDGKVKRSGIIVRGDGNPVDPRASVAFVTAACVEGQDDAVYRAERRLVGESEVSFAPMTLSPDEGRCVQIRDLVAANSLGAGRMTYFVRIVSGDEEVASQEFAFDVAGVAPPPESVIAPPAK